MKKGAQVLLTLVVVFFALIIGIFIGRNSTSGMVAISEVEILQTQSAEESSQTFKTDENPTLVSDGKIDVNTASVSVLQTLPTIGQVLAQRIVDYRKENGDFTALEDLLLVEGIGEKRLEQIREYITLGG